LLFLFLVFLYFIFLHFLHPDCDIAVHQKYILWFNEGKIPLMGHFLFFVTVSIFTFFFQNINTITFVSCLVLSFMIISKRRITEKLISTINDHDQSFSKYYFGISVLPIFMTNMPTHPPFRGLWPPITWINSTTIAVLPFCILLFYYSYLYAEILNVKQILFLLALSLIIILIKPSYLMNFVLSYPLYMLILIKNKQVTSKGFLLSFMIGVMLLLQFIYIYFFIKSDLIQYQNVRTIIAPFSAWNRISSNIPLSALSWFLLPVIILIFYNKDLLNKKMYVFSPLNFIFSLVFFILMEQVAKSSNSVLGAVEFLWQLIISLYILSIVSIAYFINSIKKMDIGR